jgi:DNA polymerase-1
MAEERRTVYLVDGSGYIFRAFFALPTLNNSRGLPTNASFGFIRMMLKLLKDARPSHIAVVFDSARKTFRDDLFESYKANRTAPPSDLVAQIPYIHRAVDAFRIPSVMIDGYEADDVIGTLAVRAAQDRFNAVIVTGDKDFMQLTGPNISLWDTMRDKRTGVREVRDRFGVEPRALVDVMALMGDAIDNVKGVPGVGEKTASALIRYYGSLEALFAGLDRIEETKIRGAKKFAGLIAENRADVELARKLVRIDTQVPLSLTPADLEWPGIDHRAVADLLRELEFGSLLAELTPAEAAIPKIEGDAEIRVDADRLDAVIKELRAAPRLSLDLVSDRGNANGELAFGKQAQGEVLKLKGMTQAPSYVVASSLIPQTAPLLSGAIPKACHDFKDHLVRLRHYGIELNGVDFDTMLAAFLVNPGRPEPSLETVYHEHLAPLGGSTPAGSEPAIIEALCERLAKRLDEQELTRLFNQIELPVARILADMERDGIGVDAEALRAMSCEFAEELARLERECHELAGREFNLGSPAQLRQVLFTDLKLSAKGLKKTKTGYSTDADALEKLAGVHPLPAKLLEYRTIAKLKSTYSDALAALIDPADGRLHTSFHQALTATGRLSSSQPNLQNIPTRTQEGRRIRRAFVPREGFVLISADYSQIELRVLAHLSGDPTLIDAFTRGEDIHTRTAAEVLGVNPDKGAGEARRLAKVINFGIIYGMGPVRLAAELGISLTEASDYIKRYFERLPGVRQYVDETLRGARERGYVTTMYGRRRYLPELNAPDGGARAQAERIAVNTPIQGTAADLIKLAMVRCDTLLRQRELRARMLLQVHDELLTETSRDSVDETCAVLREAMEGAASLKVPLKVALNWGPNWAELENHA